MRLVPFLAVLVAVAAGCDRRVAGGSTDGAAVFAAACASCHGPAGTPPQQMVETLQVRDLAGAEFVARRSRARIIEQIRGGSPNGRMPAFGGALTDAQVQAVADHVIALRPH